MTEQVVQCETHQQTNNSTLELDTPECVMKIPHSEKQTTDKQRPTTARNNLNRKPYTLDSESKRPNSSTCSSRDRESESPIRCDTIQQKQTKTTGNSQATPNTVHKFGF